MPGGCWSAMRKAAQQFLLAQVLPAKVWPEMRISHAQQQRRKFLLLQKLHSTLNPIPAAAEHLSRPGPAVARRINCWRGSICHIWAAGVCQRGADTPGAPHPARATSPLANKTLAALRNYGGFIRYLRDAHHLVVGVAERLWGLFVPLLRAAREEPVLSTIQAAAYAYGPGTVSPGGRRWVTFRVPTSHTLFTTP